MRPHLSINVANVPKSIDFYRRVFGTEPQKQTETYAKFDLSEPALNFTLNSGEPSRVNHFGIEVKSTEEVKEWEARLVKGGVLTAQENATDCCYALQDKIWFQDPDGNAWEVFVVHQQLPVEKKAAGCSTMAALSKCC